MEYWSTGILEEWKDGRMEEWKNGRMEKNSYRLQATRWRLEGFRLEAKEYKTFTWCSFRERTKCREALHYYCPFIIGR